MMKRTLIPTLIFLMSVVGGLKGQLSFKNTTQYTQWDEFDRNIVESWTDLTYQKAQWLVGGRFEVNDPPDPFIFPRDTLVDEYELTYRFVQYRYKRLTARLGNFYTIFGRGLVLRTYEDRNLRVDNNIDGLKLNFTGRSFKLQAIGGKMRDKYNRRPNTVFGFDGEWNAFGDLTVGGSFLRQGESSTDLHNVYAGRLKYSYNRLDFYGEVVKPQWHNALSYYGAINAFFSEMAFTFEVKDYNQLSFRNDYETEYNAAPSLSREHSFALLNRHPHALNLNDEKGYQFEMTYFPATSTQITLNHSQTYSHSNKRIFNEYYGDIHHYFSDKLEGRLAAAYTYDFTTRTENLTPLTDLSYNMTPRDQIHINYQHQHTINTVNKSEYDSELLILEYSRSPYLTAGLVGEYTNQHQLNNIDLDRHTWLYGNITLNFLRNQQLSVLYGSRQEGFVCVGGICRYEPEFEGIEIKLTIRF
ncbi:MAG: hypothetical protein GF313_12535 [Caldithrix sp.]|nr:hypothetical protein [Caldithrix sp.]